jgi:tripartite-type tricarboxylate transporter receptor subunit TctC
MKKGLVLAGLSFISVMLFGALYTAYGQQPKNAREFYKGEKVTLVVPFPAGGGADTFGRLLAPHLAKEFGAKEIAVENKPGGGSYRGLNWIYESVQRDGKTIGICNGTIVFVNELFGEAKAAKFKSMKEFGILGGSAGAPAAILVNSKLPYKSLKEMKGAKGLKAGTVTPLDSHSINAAVLAEALNLQDFKIVSGYSGSPALVTAVMRGELTLFLSDYTTCKKFVEQGFARIVGVLDDERLDVFPDIQTVYEVGVTPQAKKYLETAIVTRAAMRLLIAPPEVPADRLEFLRGALWTVLQNKEVQADFVKRGSIIYRPADAKEITVRMNMVLSLSPQERKEFRYIVEKKYQ